MVRNAGAVEVHMRISSPPTINPCYYGIDTPEREELLAAHFNVDQMAKHIGADSLAFISVDGLYRAVGGAEAGSAKTSHCDACFTGNYPTPLTDYNGGVNSAQLSLLTD